MENKIDISQILNTLKNMDKSELESNLSKLNSLINTEEKQKILKQIQKN